MQETRQRAFGPDLARSTAVLLVFSVHFFLYTGFYNQPLEGCGMFLSAWARMCCMSCVPLFIMLSGFLCIRQKWAPGYCRKLVSVLLSYVLAGIMCVAFRVFYMKEALSWREIGLLFTRFEAAPYGWYIEMYIGLFLLIPFLNAAWNSMDTRGKAALVWSTLAMTVLPSTVNCLIKLIPSWWAGIYPLAYYFLGAWLRERPVKARGGWLLLGWLGGGAAAVAVSHAMAPGGNFLWKDITYFNSVFVAAGSVCLFSLLIRVTGEKWPRPARRAVSWLSVISLQVYLVSYVSDNLLYPHLVAAGLTPGRRLLRLPAMVSGSALLACAMGQVLNWVVGCLDGLCRRPTAGKPAGGET